MTESPDFFIISNEFTTVTVRKIRTRNGERLELRSAAQERSITLDALALEALTWSNALEVGEGLSTPMGPEDNDGGPA